MENKDKTAIESVSTLSSICLSHANDLLRAAKTVLDVDKLPNIAYHLAVVALEEVGKADLIIIKNRTSFNAAYESVSDRRLEDHIAKLFWALWGPSFGQRVITKSQIENLRGLAKEMHENRLSALYTPISGSPSKIPKETISEIQAKNLISLVEQRVLIEETQPIRNLNEEEKELATRLIDFNDDNYKRGYIMGNESMEKLVSLGDTKEWIKWLIEKFDNYEKEAIAVTQEELKRAEPIGKEKNTPKWKIKIRFFTSSHSIRPKVLAAWNRDNEWAKLYPVPERKNQFIAEFYVPSSVPINGLWWVGWNIARKFIVSFNIGSFGYFWWYIPTFTSRYYEEISDLSRKDFYVNLERSPKLEINWKRGALSENDLANIRLCFAAIPNPKETNQIKIYDHYFSALSFLSKTDIHLDLEANSFDQFYKSLKTAMSFYKDWDGISSFDKAFRNLMAELAPTMDDIDKYLSLFNQFELTPPETKGLTLEEVAVMKIITDGYLLRKFAKKFNISLSSKDDKN